MRASIARISRITLAVGLTLFACNGSSPSGPGAGKPPGTQAAFTAGSYAPLAISRSTIGPGGGTIEASDRAGPLAGLSIAVPAGATHETISFTITYSDINAQSGLPADAVAASKLIRIETSGSGDWNNERLFDLPIRVTLPFIAPASAEEAKTIRFYVYDGEGTLEPSGLAAIDPAKHTISFYTRTFANSAEPSRLTSTRGLDSGTTKFSAYVAIGLGRRWAAMLSSGATIDTGFRAATNGWYIPNYGSYYKSSRGGSCFGFVGSAKYYYRKGYSPGLYSNYHDDHNTPTWLDDETAIELTSRVHNGLSDIWNQFVSGEINVQTPSSEQVALSYVGAMYVTGHPALLYIQQRTIAADGTQQSSGAHAIMVYQADITAGGRITFHVYDPNFPGKDDRRITYVQGTGFANYSSGTDAASSSYQYNYFQHVGFHVGLSDAVLDRLKEAADKKFHGDSVFPKIMITEVKGLEAGTEKETATEGQTTWGEHTYVTPYSAVKISGTIIGGLAQDACCVVDNARVFINNKRYSAAVNNQAGGGDGKFSLIVPVSQGDNELVIIASRKNSFSHWAAFKRDAVRSNASPSAMTVTMSWGQDKSDVDLYVKEPDQAMTGKVGDTVFWQHRQRTSMTNPYLDFDNVTGFGPEHYYGLVGMKTLYRDGTSSDDLFGDYKLRVHYYADHKCDALSGDAATACRAEPPQNITWTVAWRYLAYCPDPCRNAENDGFWVEGSKDGSLAQSGSGNCCNIDNNGPDWSEAWMIHYPRPNASEWVIPPSNRVMLP